MLYVLSHEYVYTCTLIRVSKSAQKVLLHESVLSCIQYCYTNKCFCVYTSVVWYMNMLLHMGGACVHTNMKCMCLYEVDVYMNGARRSYMHVAQVYVYINIHEHFV